MNLVLLRLSSPIVLLRKSEAAGATARPTLLILYLRIMIVLLRAIIANNRHIFYFSRLISMCFLKFLSSVLGKSLRKWTPRLSRRISAVRAMSRLVVSMF